MKFNEILSKPELLKAVEKMNFVEMSEIQAKAIPILLEGKDVIGHAKTGTGKTAAFALPMLEQLDFSQPGIKVLVMVPTRELCKQVKEEIQRLGQFIKGLNVVEIYGGTSYTIQKKDLSRKPDVVVATPGRLIDLINKKFINLGTVKYLVLDEADEMLSVGFQEELKEIATYVNKDRQTLLFSATFNDRIMQLSKHYLINPVRVSVVSKDKIAETITQYYMIVKNNEKNIALQRLLMLHHEKMIMVFANTKKQVDSTVEYLQGYSIKAEAIHGDLTQKMRENVLDKFKKGISRVLVCSDVAARGLDIKGVDIVVNMDLPFEQEFYVHRVGRTGRANQTGIAYSLISKGNERKLKMIAREFKTEITKMNMISKADLMEVTLKHKMSLIEAAIIKGQESKEDYSNVLEPLLKKGYDLDSIFLGLISMIFEEEVLEDKSGEEVRLFVNVGKKDRITKLDIVKLFNLGKEELFDIDIKATFTFVSVKVANVDALVSSVSRKKIGSRKVNVEVAN